MRVIETISRLSLNDQVKLYKKCFDNFVDTKDTYKPTYIIDSYEIERRYYLLYIKKYIDECASYDEKRLYNMVISSKQDNKFEILKNKYYEAFIMYIKSQDTEKYYETLATELGISVSTAKRYPLNYYDKYASDEERKVFDDAKIKKEQNANEKKENNLKEKLRYLYMACIESKFNSDVIEELTEKFAISPKTIRNYVKEYYDNYATEEEKNKYIELKNSIKIEKVNNARYVKIFNKLNNEVNVGNSIMFLLKNNIDSEYLKTSLNLYKQTYPEIDTNKIEKIIDNYSNYLKYRKDKKIKQQELQKQQEEMIEKSKQILEEKVAKQKELIISLVKLVKMYNKSNYKDYNDFCSKYKLSIDKFECALRVTAKADENTYEKYLEKQRNQNKKNYQKESKIIKELISKLTENPKYNLLDYYKFSKISLDELNIVAKKILNPVEYITFNTFYNKYRGEKTISPALILKADYTINSFGEQIKLDDKTKMEIINNLKNNNIPLTPKIYLEAVRRKLDSKEKQKAKVA